jgi:hypothetical protein
MAPLFVVITSTICTLTHLVTQRTASDGTCNGAKRSKNGARGSTRNSTAYSSYSLTSVATGTVPIAFVVFSHSSHSLVLY